MAKARADTRIYVVTVKRGDGINAVGEEETLVRAKTMRDARAYVFNSQVSARFADAEDVARLMSDGCEVEDATDYKDGTDPDFKPAPETILGPIDPKVLGWETVIHSESSAGQALNAAEA